MKRKCVKRRFKDEIAAKLALANIQKTDGSNREAKEVRVYEHRRSNGGCGFWHTTSQPYMTWKERHPDARQQSRTVDAR